MTQAELGRRANVTRQSISAYETGEKCPEAKTFQLLISALDQPPSFFTSERPPVFGKQKPRFFRQSGPKTIRKNEACAVFATWFVHVARYFDDYINYPNVDVLTPPAPKKDNGRYTMDEIEAIAVSCRTTWGLGLGPISNVVALLESKGIFICRREMENQKIDAFSFWNGPRPFIFLASGKTSSVRNRFDLAHELGHLILHRWIEEEELKDPKTLKEIESEADRFAGAFLLPAPSFSREIHTTRLNAFVDLKKRWRVAIQAMVYRCRDLDIIDEYQFQALYKQISFKKWRTCEPFDDPSILPLEQSKLLKKAVEMVLDAKKKLPHEILTDLNLSSQDISSFCNISEEIFHTKQTQQADILTLKVPVP